MAMSEVLTAILGGGVGAAVIAGIFMLLGKAFDRKAVKNDREEEKKCKDTDQTKAIEEMQKKLDVMDGKLDNLSEGTMATLGDILKERANQYIKAEEISSTDLDDWLRLHEIYHNKLHGNGYLDTMMEKVKRLPISGK